MDALRIGWVLGIVVVAALLFLALLWAYQRSLIYLPDHSGVPPAVAVLAAAEEVSFETDDGLRLGGWFVRGPRARGPTVIVFNGNAGNRSHRAPLARALSRAGIATLLFDYRGYGGNPGAPTEAGLAADARAARAFLDSRPDVDPERVAYFGESLGAAVATALAEARPPAALVLRSPFTSLAEIGRVHYPFLPVQPILLQDHYAVIDRIGAVRCPVLVLAGERDSIVPVAQSRRVYESANEPKRFALIAGADHNDMALLDGAALIDEVRAFLENALRPGRTARPLHAFHTDEQPSDTEPNDPIRAATAPDRRKRE
jgi:fermentation-respiration switch protein FrsA (DUF1100 family)